MAFKKIVYVLFLTFLFSGCGHSVKIEEGDGGTILTKDNFVVRAEMDEDIYEQQFVVIGCNTKKMLFLDCLISAIDLAKAESLRDNYGNFMRCANPGSEDAKHSIEDLQLVFQYSKLQPISKKINSLHKSGKYPIISLTYCEFQVTDCRRQSTTYQLDDSWKTNYLVEDIKLIEDDFVFDS